MNIVLTGFDEDSVKIAESVMARGVVGLRYVKHHYEKPKCDNVVSLCAFREKKEREQEYYDYSIVIVNQSNIKNHFDTIKNISKKSDITVVYITNMENKDFSKNQNLYKLTKLVDAVFPVTTTGDPTGEIYWLTRALIESFTEQSVTGVDASDINNLIRNSGIGCAVQFTMNRHEKITEKLEGEIYLHLTKHQLLNSHGVLISSTGTQTKMQTGMHDVQFATEFLNEQSNFNITCLINLLTDANQADDGIRRVVIIFTGIRHSALI